MIEAIGITDICMKKIEHLESKGMVAIGLIFSFEPDENGVLHRATVDNFGRVQWWNVDGSGAMVAVVSQ